MCKYNSTYLTFRVNGVYKFKIDIMGNLNKFGYQKLIDENIAALEKHMPEHSLEKKHTIEVLKWSVKQIYGSAKEKYETSGRDFSKHIVSALCCPICGRNNLAYKHDNTRVKCLHCAHDWRI